MCMQVIGCAVMPAVPLPESPLRWQALMACPCCAGSSCSPCAVVCFGRLLADCALSKHPGRRVIDQLTAPSDSCSSCTKAHGVTPACCRILGSCPEATVAALDKSEALGTLAQAIRVQQRDGLCPDLWLPEGPPQVPMPSVDIDGSCLPPPPPPNLSAFTSSS